MLSPEGDGLDGHRIDVNSWTLEARDRTSAGSMQCESDISKEAAIIDENKLQDVTTTAETAEPTDVVTRPRDFAKEVFCRPEEMQTFGVEDPAEIYYAAPPAFINEQQFDHLAEEQHLEPEDDDDVDSAMGDDTASVTTSLSESIYNYRREHGRTYHAYKDGRYFIPNDERESDRLDLQHHLFLKTFAGRLHFAPLDRPNNALDVGTGTGIWAVDFADQYPECQVIGIDLSPGQPTMVPPNLKFVIDDAEDYWVYSHKFDYIHARLMAGSFGDWPNFFRQAYCNLEDGGWLEMQDYGLPVKSMDGTHEHTNILRWGELLCEASMKLGRPLGSDACDLYEQQMRDAGFVDVHQRMFMWPTNGWPKDPLMKELGRWNSINCLDGLEGFCLALFTRALGWKREEVDIFVAQVTKDFKNRSIHAYFPMPVVLGRKPRADEMV